jgi:hypothetical protein
VLAVPAGAGGERLLHEPVAFHAAAPGPGRGLDHVGEPVAPVSPSDTAYATVSRCGAARPGCRGPRSVRVRPSTLVSFRDANERPTIVGPPRAGAGYLSARRGANDADLRGCRTTGPARQ